MKYLSSFYMYDEWPCLTPGPLQWYSINGIMSQHSSVEEEAWIINGIHRWSDAELYHGLTASHRPLSNCCVRQSQPIKLTGSERYSVTRTRSLAWIMDSPEVTPHSSLLTPDCWWPLCLPILSLISPLPAGCRQSDRTFLSFFHQYNYIKNPGQSSCCQQVEISTRFGCPKLNEIICTVLVNSILLTCMQLQ